MLGHFYQLLTTNLVAIAHNCNWGFRPKNEKMGRLRTILYIVMVLVGWDWIFHMKTCDRMVQPNLKHKFFKMVVRTTRMYKSMFWPVKKSHIQKMKVVEMKIFRWMCGHNRSDDIRNEDILYKVRVVSVKEMEEIRQMVWISEEQIHKCSSVDVWEIDNRWF